MKKTIPFLQKGDLIEIIAPAKRIEEEHVLYAKMVIEQNGFQVKISEHCLGQYNYFSGTLSERIDDLQSSLDDPNVKAILCARGGYGSIQVIDKIDWSSFQSNPKWIIGFSDVTVFHQKLQHDGYSSLHATMPLNFRDNSKEAINSLFQSLLGKKYSVCSPASEYNQFGQTEGKIIGGNLSILYSLLGTDNQPDYTNVVLYIEDLAEHIYHIDRMFYAFKKAGVLEKLNGLAVGGMTDIKDTQIPYGCTYQEVILSHFKDRNIPICFDLPAGHIDDNQAITLGERVSFGVTEKGGVIEFTEQRSS